MRNSFSESKRIELLSEWYQSAYADYLHQSVCEQLKFYLKRIPVQGLIPIGLPLNPKRPLHINIGKQISLVNDVSLNVEDFTLQDNLPLDSDSQSCLVYHHLLDVLDNPYQLLREANRVLDDAGYLIIIGFNPVSLYGLNRMLRLPWDMFKRSVPWSLKTYSQARIGNWLRVLEFVPSLHDSVGVIPPVVGDKDAKLIQKTDPFLTKYIRNFGMLSVSLYRKSLAPVTPIRTRWQVMPGKIAGRKLQPVPRGLVGVEINKHKKDK